MGTRMVRIGGNLYTVETEQISLGEWTVSGEFMGDGHVAEETMEATAVKAWCDWAVAQKDA